MMPLTLANAGEENMLAWITANLATILVCFVLLVIVTLVIAHLIRNKKRGKTSCGCNCAGCALHGSCRQEH